MEEAGVKFRHIELNAEDDNCGIQITLYDEYAYVTLPYWHSRGRAEAVWSRMFRLLTVMAAECGYAVYDPQAENIIDPRTGFDAVIERYDKVVRQLPSIIESAEPPSKPWWRFW